MTAYVLLIRERLRDEAAMQRYAAAAGPARHGHDLTALAFYGACETLEGPTAEGVVLLSFPDMDAARAWYQSPAYQEACAHRFQGADYRVVLVEGVA